MLHLADLKNNLVVKNQVRSTGQVVGVKGPCVYARVPSVAIGDVCYITTRFGEMAAQVVSFEGETVNLSPFDSTDGIAPGARVASSSSGLRINISEDPRGKVLDALGNELVVRPSNHCNHSSGHHKMNIKVQAAPPPPLSRAEISEKLFTGVRAIDGLCPIGYGQRIGLFAGAGVGKSTLLGMIARNAKVDVSVIALVGERGREVNDFIKESLGEEGLAKSVVVVATSDESPIRRMIAPQTATAIAEYYREQGLKVLLLVDSLTRTARAIREVGLAAGELPVRQGYTSSVYTELPKLLERAGTSDQGSITAIYTVLTNGDGEVDPLGEEIKSILDGHILLNNYTVNQGIRPAIDLTQSISRLTNQLCDQEELDAMAAITRILAKLKNDKDIVLLGGTPDKDLKLALDLEPKLKLLLNQRPHDIADPAKSKQIVLAIAKIIRGS